MFRFPVFLACLALCHSHAVYPVVVPAAHAIHTPLVFPYPLLHGYAGQGLLGHGLVAKPLGHHLYKRSPHYAPIVHAPLAPLAHVAHIAPVAVSHQSRVDFHTSPAFVASSVVPVLKTLVAPIVPATPLYSHGTGHYGSLYPHTAHSHY